MIGKAEIASRVAKRAGISQAKANDVVNAVTDSITEALRQGEEVRLTGFGSFRVVERSERMGRNPRTGEPITVPGGMRPAFSPGTKLIDAVRGEARRFA
mgnify:CR=1 FL=1